MILPKKNSFSKDVLKLVSGTVFAQALSIIVSPLLTRFYSPENFGLSALFSSITTIVAVGSCLRYELSIMLPDNDEEAANLLGLSLGLVILTSTLSVPLIWFTKPLIVGWLSSEELGLYLGLVPLTVFFSGVFMALNYWNSRTKHFGRLSIARIVTSVTTVGTQLSGGYMGYRTGGVLIGAGVVGSALSSLVLGQQIWRDDGFKLRHSISMGGMISGLKRHYRFPLYDLSASLFNNISWQLPAFLLSAFFSMTTVGYYALGFRIISLPMNLIGQSISQVFFQRASVAQHDCTLARTVENTFNYLVKFSLFPILMLTLIGGNLFLVFFGNQWYEAGVYVQILGVWSFFWFISSPLSTVFTILEKQKKLFWIQLLIFTSRLLSLSLGGYMGDARVALSLFSISGIMVYGYLGILVFELSGISHKKFFTIIFKNLFLFVPSGIIMSILYIAKADDWLLLCFSFGLTFMYYCWLLWENKNYFISINQ
ncbi:lipopolysaccharide biosynthesis protein [Laspinema olomoucense]|uniref:Oligosaccharide flippase family protein n=1 Tax=Laspinema olomoucense D3b TaxID=2953688 RepID=A0ABT2N1D6_9CYAN|nr:oligosaccharide flippase family protein [Laspinema sp. D3b]MCT7976494.1 oligosaccharide flippase family protein [Laspinema sp. D3b]